MRWTVGGPDYPNELLQAEEDGELILFCGAGVSCNAGLPAFCGLVERVYQICHMDPTELEKEELKKGNYDRVLTSLENRNVVTNAVRRAVTEALRIDPQAADLLGTHKALLDLGTTRDGHCRLVTTNFDRGFEYARPGLKIDCAPQLPLPKKASWRSVVHLHGRFSDADPNGLSMVLTSADFGLAYLTERWAARFVSDLFHRFTVLFVGYSVDDVVVRYMMDALAADRKLGEGVRKVSALVGCPSGKEKHTEMSWEAKGVTPLLYDEGDGHKALHESLSAWAAVHGQGLLGKESIVVRYAGTAPGKPLKSDPAVSQMLWAVSQKNGQVARRFAHHNPLPPLEWLEVFDSEGLLAKAPEASIPIFVAGYGTQVSTPLHPVTAELVEWLARHLGNTDLLNWVVEKGCQLHPAVKESFQRVIMKGKVGLPRPLRTIWELLCSDVTRPSSGYFQLQQRLANNEWDLVTKREFLTAFSPRLALRLPYSQLFGRNVPDAEKTIGDYAATQIEIEAEGYALLLRELIQKGTCADAILAGIVDDLTSLLKTTFELLQLVDEADTDWDSSSSEQPSIAPHGQNRNFQSWTHLVEILRDGWAALAKSDPAAARAVVERWQTIQYPIFRRLALYAMTDSELVTADQTLSYLLTPGKNLLWSPYVGPERFRAFLRVLPHLSAEQVDLGISSILQGPPRDMFRADLSVDQISLVVDRDVWSWLGQLQNASIELPPMVLQKVSALKLIHPDWQLNTSEQGEFTTWMSEGWGELAVAGDEEFLDLPDEEILGKLDADTSEPRMLPKWHKLCAESPDRAVKILTSLKTGNLTADILKPVIRAVSTQKPPFGMFSPVASLLATVDIDILNPITADICMMLREVSETLDVSYDPRFFEIWDCCSNSAFFNVTDEVVDDPVSIALNRPAGALTLALLARIALRGPKSATDVPEDMWKRATLIAQGLTAGHRLGHVLLASRIGWLHGLNSSWVEAELISHFSWAENKMASWVWQGFLWQPRISPGLWLVLKADFKMALNESSQLGKGAENAFRLFGFVCVNHPAWITFGEAREWLSSIPANGRATFAQILFESLAATKETASVLWSERIKPLIVKAWPKDLALLESGSSLYLALTAACAKAAFTDAADTVLPFLTPIKYPYRLVQQLLGNKTVDQSPALTLALLEHAVGTAWQQPSENLRTLLKLIGDKDPALRDLNSYRTLDEHLRQFEL